MKNDTPKSIGQKLVRTSLFIVLMLLGLTGITQAQDIRFSFGCHAKNVRVAPPLVGEWQLGYVTTRGEGRLRNGRWTGGLWVVFRPTRGSRAGEVHRIRCNIIGAAPGSGSGYTKVGNAHRLALQVRIIESSHPRRTCPVGTTGVLMLQDSSDVYRSNSKTLDYMKLGGWSAECGAVHGFNNADPAPGTVPTFDPPRGGEGMRARVDIYARGHHVGGGHIIKFRNNSPSPVKLYLRYRNMNREWKNLTYDIKPSSNYTTLASTNNVNIKSNNSIIYYYAESTSGRKITWSGNEYRTIGGRSLPMKKKQLSQNKDGSYYFGIKSSRTQNPGRSSFCPNCGRGTILGVCQNCH